MPIDKITNLYRVNYRSKLAIIRYLFKRVFKIKPSKIEDEIYFLYMLLISENGIVKQEKDKFFNIQFNKNFQHTLRLRKFPSSDILVYNQIYGYREYEPVVRIYKQNFGSDSESVNIIDAGGNIGISSIYFLQNFVQPNIVIIEPAQENFEVLKFNLEKYQNIIKINGALWKKNGKLNILNDFRDKSDWAFRVEEDENGSIEAFTLNFLLDKYHLENVDILKIDIEGAEKEIFTTNNNNLDFLNRTKCIAIEIHDEFHCREQILKILDDYGFSLYHEKETTVGINRRLLKPQLQQNSKRV
ncbi:FkbM family methyltransferase [Chryseobacterium gotjawalense]|uniref:FkbM family methyltransferase n=1 Tax=Chryseobacterium gotjawalense TaxID=3042315 RepID=A0ABY8RDX9_9FLAO|nr:FkbM family methyltransferase [Chryseobacterium sp. wdc7]WHF51432.1 FkbM family methyltransferase [Chryseobacterium sp. wdc7]